MLASIKLILYINKMLNHYNGDDATTTFTASPPPTSDYNRKEIKERRENIQHFLKWLLFPAS